MSKGLFQYHQVEITYFPKFEKKRVRQLAINNNYQPLKHYIMLRWTVTFIILAIIAGIFGFGGIAAGAASIAKILFVIFIVLFVISLITGRKRI